MKCPSSCAVVLQFIDWAPGCFLISIVRHGLRRPLISHCVLSSPDLCGQVDGYSCASGVVNIHISFGPTPTMTASATVSASLTSAPSVSATPSPSTPPPPPNDNFTSPSVIAAPDVVSFGYTVGATVEMGEVSPGTGGQHSIWYRWQSPATGSFNITTVGSSFDTLLGVYVDVDGTLSHAVVVATNDDCIPGVQLTSCVLVPSMSAGVRYALQVDGYNGAAGSVSIAVNTWLAPSPTPSPSESPTISNTPSTSLSATHTPPVGVPSNDLYQE